MKMKTIKTRANREELLREYENLKMNDGNVMLGEMPTGRNGEIKKVGALSIIE